MAKSDTVSQLQKLVEQLRAERQNHVEAIEEIDRTFGSLGVGGGAAAPTKRRGRPPKKVGRPRGSRTRGQFQISGEESVVNFVRQHGNPTTAEVNEHWRAEGRKGKADNTITKLVKEKKLKRNKIKGERGSRYRV